MAGAVVVDAPFCLSASSDPSHSALSAAGERTFHENGTECSGDGLCSHSAGTSIMASKSGRPLDRVPVALLGATVPPSASALRMKE